MKKISDGKDGNLYIAESKIEIPFPIRRVYFITNLRKESLRGLHAHRKLHQVIYCLRGKFRLNVYDGDLALEVKMKNPEEGYYLRPYVWHAMDKFSKDCLICVFASGYYDEKDYIRDFSEFKRLVK